MNNLPIVVPCSIQELRNSIREKKPYETTKFDNALKYVIPQLLPHEKLIAPLAHERLAELAPRIPAEELLKCFEGKQWASALVRNDERFKTLSALSGEYRASTIRCLKHAKHSRLIPHRPKRLSVGQQAPYQQLDNFNALRHRTKRKSHSAKRRQLQRHKQLMEADPMLWHRLVFEGLPYLRYATNFLKDVLESEKDPAMRNYWRKTWAAALRDEILFGLLLALQLRGSHLSRAKLGVDFFPQTYEFTIPGTYDKKGRPQRIQIPSNGPLSKLRGLIDLYLDEARTILLDGRPETPYLFLSIERGLEVRDAFGNLMMWDGQLRRTLNTISLMCIKHLLPKGLDFLSPHDFRNIWANYALGAGHINRHQPASSQPIEISAHSQ